jgi:hypothetical protein
VESQSGKSKIDIEISPPNVLAIQQPDPQLKRPHLIDTGVLLTKAKGNLLEVKEMDKLYSHGFKSSFVQHHLANSPNVSAIPSLPQPLVQMPEEATFIANLPTGSPEVCFVSWVNRTDTVAAHVDTGATVIVSNVQGEIHGAVPTTAYCGTALTGSKTTIDALGTWMVDLVGSDNGKDLPLALRGKAQNTGFQCRSMSLHALKEAGFDCSHVMTQNGNYLDISASGIQYQFPLITIYGRDYIKMHVHCPLLESVVAATVARLDLAKNFKPKRLYHLLHLQYECPGIKQMDMILKGIKTWGVPANVTIPEFFRCPIALSVTRRKQMHYQPLVFPTRHSFPLAYVFMVILASTTLCLSTASLVSCF